MTQPDLFTYPLVPGHKVGGTSAEAAESMKPTAATLRAKCLGHLQGWKHCPGTNGLTADEIAADLAEHPFSIRPRIAELHALGLIRDTGERRANASGRRAIVWRLA